MFAHSKVTYFLAACFLVLAVFVIYQDTYGTQNSQAYASLTDRVTEAALPNYKPARKRILRSQIKRDVDSVLNFNGRDIIQIFSEPELVRRDLPTTIWQYRNEACVLDIYFTTGSTGNVEMSNVVHYEIRERNSRSQQDVDKKRCVRNLLVNDTMMSLINVDAFYKSDRP